MKIMRSFSSGLLGLAVFCAVGLLSSRARAQDTNSVSQAFQVAKTAVNPAIQDRVVSIYGIGTPAAIQKWYIIFYDSSVPSHGRSVLVQNGAVVRTYEAQGGMTYSSRLTFNPSLITGEQPALNAAQNYAAQHNIAYTGVRALLRQTSVNRPFRWRIELLDSGTSEGFVLVNALNDTVAGYVSPSDASPSSGTSGSGSLPADAEGFGNDVKHTFLGIGGDLQQFFTGERTVDR